MKRLKFLQEERARIAGEMKSIMDLCETENRSRSAEEKTKWADLKKKLDDTEDELRDLQAQEDADRRTAKPVGDPSGAPAAPEAKPKDMSLRGQIAAWHEANKAVIDGIINSRSNALPKPLEVRVAETMTIANSVPSNSPYLPNVGLNLTPIDLVRTRPTFWSRLQKGRTSFNPIVWVNKTNKQGNAEFIGEGVLKPLASFDLATETSNAKKVAERFKVSTELLNDLPRLQSMIENEARFEVETAANTATLTGTASSTSPAGVTTIASAFTLTTVDVQNANNFDAIRAAIAQLQTLNFDRDIVAFVNPIDAAEMDMAKGSDGHYVLPPFISQSGTVVKGVPVIEDNNIAVGFLLIGDMTKYKIEILEDFRVEWGWENDDFSKNLVTMIAEMRFHQYYSANHAGAWIYDSFADIKAAIYAT